MRWGTVVDSQIRDIGGRLKKLLPPYRAFVLACCSRVDVRQLETPFTSVYTTISNVPSMRGSMRRGSKIPTEVELAERYLVSRITVRRAIEDLSTAGILIKRRGRGPSCAHRACAASCCRGDFPKASPIFARRAGAFPVPS